MKNERPCRYWLASLALIPVQALVAGWSLMLMWSWFVVPLGAPALDVWGAIGLGFIAASFMMGLQRRPGWSTDEDSNLIEVQLRSIAGELLVLGMASVVHLLQEAS